MLEGLRIRDARPSDKRAVLAFCRRTWGEYGDYMHRVWPAWIRDRGGRFIAAELDGVPVGTAKITDFGDGEVWLEGLRVDPKHRGEGIANALNLEVRRTLERMRPRKVRYSTGRTNWASRHIGGKFGFRVAARMKYTWAKPRRGKLRGEVARLRDAEEVFGFIKSSRYLKLTGGLIAEGWIFREFTRRRLTRYLRQRRVMVLREGGRLGGVAVYPDEGFDPWLCVGFVDGSPEAIRTLIKNCPHLAAAEKKEGCSVIVPTRYFARVAREAGLRGAGSMGQIVFEYEGRFGPHSGSLSAPEVRRA